MAAQRAHALDNKETKNLSEGEKGSGGCGVRPLSPGWECGRNRWRATAKGTQSCPERYFPREAKVESRSHHVARRVARVVYPYFYRVYPLPNKNKTIRRLWELSLRVLTSQTSPSYGTVPLLLDTFHEPRPLCRVLKVNLILNHEILR